MTDQEHTPWSLEEFRQRVAVPDDRDDDYLLPLLDMCNKALENGLSRADVDDVLSDLSDASNEISPAELVGALVQRAYPVSDEEREAFGHPTPVDLAQQEIDAYRRSQGEQ